MDARHVINVLSKFLRALPVYEEAYNTLPTAAPHLVGFAGRHVACTEKVVGSWENDVVVALRRRQEWRVNE